MKTSDVTTIGLLVVPTKNDSSMVKMHFWSFDSNFNDQSSTLNFSAFKNAVLSNVTTITGYGSSLSLNATQAQYLSCGNSFLNLTDTSWTFEVWIYLLATTSNTDYSLIEQCQSTTPDRCLHLMIRKGKAYLGFYSDDRGGNQAIQPSQWYHLAFTFDCQTKNQSIYINGFLDAHRGADHCYQGQSGNLTMGKSLFQSSPQHFEGFIDQLYYFNEVRTPKEILDDASLTVHLSFDNYSLNDQGPLGIHGHVSGSVNFTTGIVGSALHIHPISHSFVRVAGLVQLGVTNQSYSISIWIRPDERRNSTIVHVSDQTDGTRWCIAMLVLTSQGQLIASLWSGARRHVAGPIVSLNQWTHVAITYSRSVGLSLYTNGTLSNLSTPFPFIASGSTRNYLFLGSSVAGTATCGAWSNYNGQYAGALDEFRLYSRALTPREICDLVNP
jgi:Concanavalin A-like lectin/glucanases superfamily